MHFGQAVEADMEAAVKVGKNRKSLSEAEYTRRRMAVLNGYLGTTPVKQFRDPVAQRKA